MVVIILKCKVFQNQDVHNIPHFCLRDYVDKVDVLLQGTVKIAADMEYENDQELWVFGLSSLTAAVFETCGKF